MIAKGNARPGGEPESGAGVRGDSGDDQRNEFCGHDRMIT